MLTKISISRIFYLFAVLLLLSTIALGDTIRLKDGSIIKGKITSFSGGRFTVSVGEGERTRQIDFAADEVDSIQFDSPMSTPPAASVDTNSAEPTPPKKVPKVLVTENTTPTLVIKQPTTTTVPPPVKSKSNDTSLSPPISLSVKVIADNTNNGWTNSGFVVRKGQTIKISATGEISLGGGNASTPSGKYDIDDETKLLKAVPTGALIAVIGDDNNEFIYIGSERTFTATRDGALFLGVNEGKLEDNSGSFAATIEINPS